MGRPPRKRKGMPQGSESRRGNQQAHLEDPLALDVLLLEPGLELPGALLLLLDLASCALPLLLHDLAVLEDKPGLLVDQVVLRGFDREPGARGHRLKRPLGRGRMGRHADSRGLGRQREDFGRSQPLLRIDRCRLAPCGPRCLGKRLGRTKDQRGGLGGGSVPLLLLLLLYWRQRRLGGSVVLQHDGLLLLPRFERVGLLLGRGLLDCRWLPGLLGRRAGMAVVPAVSHCGVGQRLDLLEPIEERSRRGSSLAQLGCLLGTDPQGLPR